MPLRICGLVGHLSFTVLLTLASALSAVKGFLFEGEGNIRSSGCRKAFPCYCHFEVSFNALLLLQENRCCYFKRFSSSLILVCCCIVLQEAVSTGDPEMVQLVLQRRDYLKAYTALGGVPELLSKIREVCFYIVCAYVHSCHPY